MAEYKKKSVKKVKPEREPKPERIKMKSADKKGLTAEKARRSPREFKVIKGEKGDVKITPLIIAAILVILTCGYFIILSLNPVGVFEAVASSYKKLGSGRGYDISLKGDKIIDVSIQNNSYYLLTDTEVLCYNTNGKTISALSHGFVNPIIKTAKTRALIYGQGGKHLKIYNYDDIKADLTLDSQILSADIADNGNFAVAGYASGYDSIVRVYNKKSEIIFEWYSADGVVSDVAFTPDGKKVYITTFTSSDGVINSKLSLYNFKSADAEKTKVFSNDIPFDIYVTDKNSVFAVFENKVCHYNFKTGTENIRESEYSNLKAFYNDKRLAVVSGLSANLDKSNILMIDNKGAVKSDFSVDFHIEDIALYKDSYYLLSDGNIFKCDLSGKISHSAEVDADTERVIPVSDKIIAAIKKTVIIKSELKELHQ